MAIVIVAITDNCWENRIKIILGVIINYNFMLNSENSNDIKICIFFVFIYLFGDGVIFGVTLCPDRQTDGWM